MDGAIYLERRLGFQGGNELARIGWRPEVRIWSYFDFDFFEDRFWCAYGADNPADSDSLNIAVEINPPKVGVNRRIQGAVLRDADGRTVLAHLGRLGGGRPGIGKHGFAEHYTDATWETAEWPDGQTSTVIVIGTVTAETFPTDVARFVHAVTAYKSLAVYGSAGCSR